MKTAGMLIISVYFRLMMKSFAISSPHRKGEGNIVCEAVRCSMWYRIWKYRHDRQALRNVFLQCYWWLQEGMQRHTLVFFLLNDIKKMNVCAFIYFLGVSSDIPVSIDLILQIFILKNDEYWIMVYTLIVVFLYWKYFQYKWFLNLPA